jgi:AcrR family transcriptional regulator
VDALVEATARILVRDGFDQASTNRIAAAAGVSVGSLYQYFPSKEALVAAVGARHDARLMAVANAALADVADLPLATAVRRLVGAAIAAHRSDPDLHRVLAEQTPRTGALAERDPYNRAFLSMFRGWLAGHAEALRPLDLDLAAFVCVTSIEAITHTAVLHRPDLLEGAAGERLVDEATRLVLGYLEAAG